MKSIAVSRFRSNMMRILKKIEQGSCVVITSHGKAIAKLVPPDDLIQNSKQRLKEIRKTAVIKDVLSPIDEKWEVLQ